MNNVVDVFRNHEGYYILFKSGRLRKAPKWYYDRAAAHVRERLFKQRIKSERKR